MNNNIPRISSEEYAAKKKAEKDAVYQLIDATALEIVQDSDKFKAFLDTQSKMDRYSVANTLLIHKQYPKATQIREFEDWDKADINIKKGEKSFSILEPVEYTRSDGTTSISYNVKKVFDISQTTGTRQPATTANRDPQALVAMMIDSSPVNVEVATELPHPNMGAYYDNNRQTLFIKKGFGDSVSLCQCVAQELGYVQLSIDSDSYSRKDLSHKAMCIGYMICKKYGVDAENIAIECASEDLKNKGPKEIRSELTKCRSAYSEIINRISDEVQRQKQTRSKGQER